jgi:hypothetical protein
MCDRSKECLIAIRCARVAVRLQAARTLGVTAMNRARSKVASRWLWLLAIAAGIAAHATVARGRSGPSWNAEERARPVTSVFFIAKSQNRNQVHYGVRVDAHCRIASAASVYAYWREFEVGPRAVSPLLGIEQPAYGMTAPRAIADAGGASRVAFSLRAFAQRSITIQSFGSAGACKAWAITTIAKQPALLRSIYVELGFLFSVDYLQLDGYRLSDGAAVFERID